MKKYLFNIFNYVFILSFLLIFIGTLFFNKSLIYQEKSYILLLSFILMLLFMCGIYFFLVKKIKIFTLKKEIIIASFIFLIIIVLQILCLHFLKSSPGWDWKDICNSALAYVKGDFTSIDYDYFQKFENNYGMLYFEIFIFKVINIFGLLDHFLGCMVLTNLILVDISIILIYLTVRNIFDNKRAIFSMVLVLFTIPFYSYLPILYTDTASMLFPILLLYLYSFIIKNKVKSNKQYIIFILIGCITVLAIKIKFTCIIIAIAICIDLLLRFNFKNNIKNLAAILIPFLICNTIYMQIESNLPIFNFDVSNNDKAIPYTHWIMMGLGRRESGIKGYDFIGSYSKEAYDLTLSYDTKKKRESANIDEIKRIVFHEYGVKNYLAFLYDKALFVWSDGTYYAPAFLRERPLIIEENIFSSLLHSNGKNVKYMFNENIAMSLFMYLMFIFSAIGHIKTKKNIISVTHIGIFGMLIFFLIWESSSRYLVNYVPIFLVCTINGMSIFIEYIKNIFLNCKNKTKLLTN